MKKMIVTALLCLLSAGSFGQTLDDTLSSYLIVPQPSCNFNVVSESTFYDSLLSRHDLYLPVLHDQLSEALSQNDRKLAAKIRLGMAKIYAWLDSTDEAQACLEPALDDMR